MNLETTYCGLRLAHPFMPGASPMVDDLDTVRRLEAAGASAIVMHSLFEEQVVHEQIRTHASVDATAHSHPEALSYLPDPSEFHLGPNDYLRQIEKIKRAVRVPVIGSLNGVSNHGWLRYGRLIEQAGADALELNVYELSTAPGESTADIEAQIVELVRELSGSLTIPVAVKLLPMFAGLSDLASRLFAAGAQGLILFNPVFNPVIDIENLTIERAYPLSQPSDLPPRLRWLGVLSPVARGRLAVSGGVHSVDDAIRALMCGADAVQLVSVLLRLGPEYLRTMIDGVVEWMSEFEYESIDQMRGSMNVTRCPNPEVYTRTGYIQTLASFPA